MSIITSTSNDPPCVVLKSTAKKFVYKAITTATNALGYEQLHITQEMTVRSFLSGKFTSQQAIGCHYASENLSLLEATNVFKAVVTGVEELKVLAVLLWIA